MEPSKDPSTAEQETPLYLGLSRDMLKKYTEAIFTKRKPTELKGRNAKIQKIETFKNSLPKFDKIDALVRCIGDSIATL
jgi:hypothetical protein